MEYLLILEVSEFVLLVVELIPKGQVVLVPLLDFEDVCLELRDQEVLLVAGEMDAVVILQG